MDVILGSSDRQHRTVDTPGNVAYSSIEACPNLVVSQIWMAVFRREHDVNVGRAQRLGHVQSIPQSKVRAQVGKYKWDLVCGR